MAESANSVELGFVEKRAAWKLRSKFFASKVGGSPAWLRLNNLPPRSNLMCSTCNTPLVFLMQVYAPILEIESAFHRTIYIFLCLSSKCNEGSSNKNFVVLRSQLSRQNEFYSFDPPVYCEKTSSDPSAEKYQTICCICGFPASLKCSSCDKKNYCSEDHRSKDWEWNHKSACESNNSDGTKRKKTINHFLLPEFELVTETEELPAAEPEKSEEQRMKEYERFMESSSAPKEMQELPMDELDSVMMRKDKAFNKFQKRVKLEPEQVLRYEKAGTPLWVSSDNIPSSKDVPDCSCGSKRVFEFQIMPQLLNHLSLDSVDWGTLAIYTCSQSCSNDSENYVKEFLWKQDFSDDNIQ